MYYYFFHYTTSFHFIPSRFSSLIHFCPLHASQGMMKKFVVSSPPCHFHPSAEQLSAISLQTTQSVIFTPLLLLLLLLLLLRLLLFLFIFSL